MQWQSFLKAFLVLLYFMIAAQGAFYIVGMYRIMGAMQAADFVSLRKIANPVLEPRLRLLYYSSLVVMAIALIFPGRPFSSAIYVTTLIAGILLVVDVALIMKWSLPLNRGIEQADPGMSAREFQMQWLRQIYIRGWISMAGFFSLLLGCAFAKTP